MNAKPPESGPPLTSMPPTATETQAGDRDTGLLEQAAEALMDCAKVALTVKPNLDKPYPGDPRWSPWTRWVERRARRAHDLAIEIRRHLAATGRRMP